MKRSNSFDNHILKNEEGTTYGAFLAADYTAEHESGIAGIHGSLGMKAGDSDFSGFIASGNISSQFHLLDIKSRIRQGKKTIAKNGIALSMQNDPQIETLLYNHEDHPLVGAWDDRSFAIGGYGKEGEDLIHILHEGIKLGDLAIWLGGNGDNPFGRNGLAIARPSLTPPHLIEKFNAVKKDRRELLEAARMTGIEERVVAGVRAYGFGIPFFALSPVWTQEKRKKDTAHPVMFWLNPVGKDVNYGYFTVEELELWIQGKGPILKKAS